MPSQQELDRFHTDSFDSFSSVSESQMFATPSSLAQQYVQLLLHEGFIRSLVGLKILDFGAGFGDMSAYLSSKGANVVAVEPFGFEVCEAKGLSVYRSLEELLADRGSEEIFDAIIMLEVLEHLIDPLPVLKALHGLLRSNGWLFVSTPNSRSAKARLVGRHWRELKRGGHVILYSPPLLRTALRDAGFDSITTSRYSVRFNRNPLTHIIHVALQNMGLGGSLKVIANKAPA